MTVKRFKITGDTDAERLAAVLSRRRAGAAVPSR